MKRSSGILLHPTSFPGPYGCGDLGESSKFIIDWLKKAGQTILQILPIGPTGYGDSPYQSFSAFAGNPYFISFDELIKKQLLTQKDLTDYPKHNIQKVDYSSLYENNFKILYKAFINFKKNIPDSYKSFIKENSDWLNDYALFMSLKDFHNGACWNTWEEKYKKRTDLINLPEQIQDMEILLTNHSLHLQEIPILLVLTN